MKLIANLAIAAAVAMTAAPLAVSANPPPPPPPHHAPPPGVQLRPGMMWCTECHGHGTLGRTWYFARKTCPKCGGTGMLPRPVPPPPPPKVHPPKAPHPPKGAPHQPNAGHHQPNAGHHQPAPAQHPGGDRKGPPRR